MTSTSSSLRNWCSEVVVSCVLTDSDLIDVWEQAAAEHHIIRPVVILRALDPGSSAADLANEPLGLVNVRLIRLREALVGSQLTGCFDCPSCAEMVEVDFDTSLLAGSAAELPAVDGKDLEGVRAVTTADLIALIGTEDPAAVLRERCSPTNDISLAELSAQLATIDPAAEFLLDVVCPSCGRAERISLDIFSFVWTEVERLVTSALDEIDVLARTYGWSERAILELTPTRRRTYAELARR